MGDAHELHRALAEFGRDLQAAETTRMTVEMVNTTVLEDIDGADAVGVALLHRGERMETLAPTHPFVGRAALLQHELDEGPCIDAVRDHEVVHAPDLTQDQRWPRWAATVVERWEVRSMLCVQLFVRDRHVGALTMFAHRPASFSTDDVEISRFYAAQAAVAVAATQEVEQLKTGMASRGRIGQAQGILMERFDVDELRAFGILRRTSQHLNRKLVEVSEELVETRHLPGTD